MYLDEFQRQWLSPDQHLLVHTSGSTGEPKPLWVEKSRMQASARITCRFLGLHEGDTALLCLPLDYIAGKMMAVRAWTCRLRLLSVLPGSHPMAALKQNYPEEKLIDFAAMIPLQVVRSLENPDEAAALKGIKKLIIGGGPVDDSLAQQLRHFPHAVYSTYGMTETLSHIALRRLSGPDASLWYTPFEGVSVTLDADRRIVIDAPAVCAAPLITNDIGELHDDGRHFRVLGRIDNVVSSGGIKVQAEEVERLLAPVIPVPFFVTATPDAVLGQAVTLVVQKSPSPDNRFTLATDCCSDIMPGETPDQWLRRHHDRFARLLPPYWCPRKALFVDRLPMTATGKIIRRL